MMTITASIISTAAGTTNVVTPSSSANLRRALPTATTSDHHRPTTSSRRRLAFGQFGNDVAIQLCDTTNCPSSTFLQGDSGNNNNVWLEETPTTIGKWQIVDTGKTSNSGNPIIVVMNVEHSNYLKAQRNEIGVQTSNKIQIKEFFELIEKTFEGVDDTVYAMKSITFGTYLTGSTCNDLNQVSIDDDDDDLSESEYWQIVDYSSIAAAVETTSVPTTSSPTASPTSMPTLLPTSSPTKSPTEPPTSTPTSSGTNAECATFALSEYNEINVQSFCDGHGDGDKCCTSDTDGTIFDWDTCSAGWLNNPKEVTLCKGSCQGYWACAEIGGCAASSGSNMSVKFGIDSCQGNYACDSIAGCAPAITSIEIGDYSCSGGGQLNCFGIAYGKGESVHVGESSCISGGGGNYACDEIGDSRATHVAIGDNACIGNKACDSIGQRELIEIGVENGQCLGNNACNQCYSGYNLGITSLIVSNSTLQCTAA